MNDRPRLLDLFCGAGGAAMGYHRAGFDVVGVDIKPQPHYPFEFHQGDALTWPLDGFDAIHASPPCQAYTSMRHFGKGAGVGAPELVEQVRERLESAGVPWVMENVPGAPLRNTLMLCGSSFGLGVQRHRLFECSHVLMGMSCAPSGRPRPIAVYGDHPQGPHEKPSYRVNRATTLAIGQEAMGIDWMPWKVLTQAIPPAYTQFIGEQLMRLIRP
jgi:DNA (cytosine-5)-methyltransferase 1